MVPWCRRLEDVDRLGQDSSAALAGTPRTTPAFEEGSSLVRPPATPCLSGASDMPADTLDSCGEEPADEAAIRVDRELRVGTAACVRLAPQAFRVHTSGTHAVVLSGAPTADKDLPLKAVEIFPMQAISVKGT